MSESTLRRERSGRFIALARITPLAVTVNDLTKAEVKRFFKHTMICQCSENKLSIIDANRATKVCTNVAQERGGLIEAELQGENPQCFNEQVKVILIAIRNQDITIWEPFFIATENMITRQICMKMFVNFTAFVIALFRRYKNESPKSSVNWATDVVAEMVSSAYERYHINEWIQEQGGWRGVLQLVRNEYQSFVDCVPVPRGLVWWSRQVVVKVGVAISAIVIGVGDW